MASTLATARTLNIQEAFRLGQLVAATFAGEKCRWILDGTEVIVEGTLRSIGDERGNFASAEDDVRDCFLRVTTTAGFESFLPVSQVLPKLTGGTFALTDR